MSGKVEEKRVDPADGVAYTFDQIASFYQGKYKKDAVAAYWAQECTPTKKAKGAGKEQVKTSPAPKAAARSAAEASTKAPGPSAKTPEPSAKAPLRRTRSWLVKVGNVALLPCEDTLQPLLEEYQQRREAGDAVGMDDVQLRILQGHPFVTAQSRDVPTEAMAEGVSCKPSNFKMDVRCFQKWLRTDAGRPFAEKGKGYDDGCYLTSGLLRSFMPRGYTNFAFTNTKGETATVVMRGFFKFTGLTATDEDEESGATEETDAFLFHGYTRDDASRFAVTTKSNGENGKYTVRKVFGEWYCFAGSKNTGVAWRLGADVAELFPVKAGDAIASVGPKIVGHVQSILSDMKPETQAAFLEAVDRDRFTVMVEFNDPTHEHIFPITEVCADHVAILDRSGYPLPQKETYAFFDRFGLRRVSCEVHEGLGNLDAVMEKVRASKEIEGVVIYLERADDTAVGLIKVKSDHYVIARRTREIMRGALVAPLTSGRASLDEALQETRRRLRKGMKDLVHVGGCKEHHEEWADFAVAFAESWAAAYRKGVPSMQKALVREYDQRYGSMYMRFYTTKEVLPLLSSGEDAAAEGGSSSGGKGGGKRSKRGNK